jgi:PST family polysaccharide transporter
LDISENIAVNGEINATGSAVALGLPPARQMDRSLVHSVAWNAAGDWISQLFSWASFLIVIRLLAPADFGIVAMAVSVMPFLQYFAGCGIPRAIVALRDLTDHQLAQLNSLVLLLGLTSFGLAALLAKPFATFYRTPRLTAVLIVTSISLIFGSAQAVSNAMLVREMRFRTLSLFGAFSAVVAAVLTLLFAWLGWGYWALILGNLLAAVFRCALVIGTRRQPYAFPHWNSVNEPVTFGRYIVSSLIALSLYQNLDNFTAGRMLGQTALGLYGMAWTLANVPLEKVTSMVTTVVPTYLVAVQDDLGAVRRYLRNLTEGLALITFPACVGLGMVAREFVPLVLGRKWEGAVAPLQVLAIYAAVRSIVALLPKLLTALGEPRFVMWNDLATLVVLGVAFYLGSHWGIVGIAWGWVVAYPVVVVPLYGKTFVRIKMKAAEYLRSLRPALEATFVMVLAVGCVKYALPGNWPLPLRLCLEITGGAGFYGGTLLLRHRDRMFVLVNTVKSFLRA